MICFIFSWIIPGISHKDFGQQGFQTESWRLSCQIKVTENFFCGSLTITVSSWKVALWLFQRMKRGINTVFLMLSFCILKWEDNPLWKSLKNIEFIPGMCGEEVGFLFSSTHTFFSSLFCSVICTHTHTHGLGFFGPVFSLNFWG